jgi:phage tail sheath protein FI
MTIPTFGLTITRVDEETRSPIFADMSVLGIIGTAPNATAAFPINTPVLIFSNDTAALTALGEAGTLADAIALVNAQLGELQGAAKIVVVRVTQGVDAAATIANIVGDGISTGIKSFLRAPAETGYTPRLIAAPGFTSQTLTGVLMGLVSAAGTGYTTAPTVTLSPIPARAIRQRQPSGLRAAAARVRRQLSPSAFWQTRCAQRFRLFCPSCLHTLSSTGRQPR